MVISAVLLGMSSVVAIVVPEVQGKRQVISGELVCIRRDIVFYVCTVVFGLIGASVSSVLMATLPLCLLLSPSGLGTQPRRLASQDGGVGGQGAFSSVIVSPRALGFLRGCAWGGVVCSLVFAIAASYVTVASD